MPTLEELLAKSIPELKQRYVDRARPVPKGLVQALECDSRQGAHQFSAIWLKQMIHPAGAPAITEFRVEDRFAGQTKPEERFAIVRAIPRTGRTHQIRVHLAHLGHSLIGDKIYGPNEQCYLRFIETGWTEELARELFLPRHALHSARLHLEGEFDWQSPLPEDLRSWVAQISERRNGG